MKRGLMIGLLILSLVFVSGASSCESQNTGGLKIVLKDLGFPEIKYLQPTVKEVQLKNEAGQWITIWSNSEGKTVKLTPDGAEVVLDTVSVPAGTYTETKLKVSSVDVEADINRDGDTDDKNVEVILTLEEFNSLPQREKPQAPEAPQQPQAPEAPQAPQQPQAPEAPQQPQAPEPPQGITGAATEEPPQQPQEPSRPEEPQEPSKPSEPQQPPKPEEPEEPQAPYTIEGGFVHMGEFLDEKHTATPPYWDGVEEHTGEYFFPIFESKFAYDGSGGKLTYDFTLHPLKQKRDQISVAVIATA